MPLTKNGTIALANKRMAFLEEKGFPVNAYPKFAKLLAQYSADALPIGESWFMNGLLRMLQCDADQAYKFLLSPDIRRLYCTKNAWPQAVSFFEELSKKKEGERNLFVAYPVNEVFRSFLPSFYNKSHLPLEIVIAVANKAVKTDVLYFFRLEEVLDFFIFSENVLKLIKSKKINVIYALDRSGRILGFLIYCVLSRLGFPLGLKGIKCYFIHAARRAGVTFYSEMQKEEIKGKNILVIDEYVDTGETRLKIMRTLETLSNGIVIFMPFYSKLYHEGVLASGLSNAAPSWFWEKEYSGVVEKPEGGVAVEIELGAKRIAGNVRKVLSLLADVIVEYLKMKE
ncbi:MAG: hypothetical protein HY363_03845 [Candidatus Aenigmarchaeota archaeon]|nr:hypothetical protein [Candidatus Aenigmarchaeota archaeon]